MSRSAAGWSQVTLGEVASFVRGVTYQKANARSEPESGYVPLLRATNISGGRLVLADFVYVPKAGVKAGQFCQSGDTLIATSSGSISVVGKSAFVEDSNSSTFGAFCGVLRPSPRIDARFLFHFVSSPSVRDMWRDAARGTNINNLKANSILATNLALPPLEEQRRIVDVLEGHLSRLEAGVAGLTKVEKATESMRKAIIISAIPDELPSSWEMRTVDDVGDARLGRQRHPDWHNGPNMHPYLRVANVFEDRIDTSDVMEMDFTDCFDQFQLAPGDVLLNEGQSPHLLGRPAIYRGVPARVAFTNSLIRFRPHAGVTSEWALLVFRHHMHSRRFMRESRITTNIAHLSLTRLKGVEFPVPPPDEQMRIVDEINVQLDRAQHFRTTASVAIKKALILRRAMLTAAFTGKFASTETGVRRV